MREAIEILRSAGEISIGLASLLLIALASRRIAAEMRSLGAEVADDVLRWAIVFASLLLLLSTAAGMVGLLSSPIALFFGALLLFLFTRVLRRSNGSPLPLSRVMGSAIALVREHRGLFAAASILLAALGIFFLRRWGSPPSSWDALTYHLDFAAHWLAAGRLETLHQGWGDPSPTYYPLATEQLYFWMLSVTRSDWWTSFAQIPAVFLSSLALWGIAREMGLAQKTSAWAILLWLSTPVLLRQAGEAETEIWFAAWMLAAARFGLSFASRGRPTDLVFSLLSLGVGVGSKYVGLLIIPTIALILTLSWRSIPRSSRIGFGKALAAGIVVAGIAGGWTYARNVITAGNPILPMRLEVFGRTILPGIFDASEYFGAREKGFSIPGFFFSLRGVLDAGATLWLSLLGFASAAFALGRARENQPAARRIAAAACVITFVLVLVFIPYRQHKYFLLPFALCAPFAAALLRSPLALGVVLVNASLSLFYVAKDAVLRSGSFPIPWSAFLFLGAAIALGVLFAKTRALVRKKRSAIRVALGGAALLSLAWFQRDFEGHRFALWEDSWSHAFDSSAGFRVQNDRADWSRCWLELAEQTGSRPTAVAYAGVNLPYPLRGRGLASQVFFVPATPSCSDARFFWGGSLYDPSEESSATHWLPRLRSHGVEYVCVFRFENGSWPVEYDWATDHPEMLELVWRAQHAALFRRKDTAVAGHDVPE